MSRYCFSDRIKARLLPLKRSHCGNKMYSVLLDRLEQQWLHPSPWIASYLPLAREVLTRAKASSIVTALDQVAQERSSPVRFIEHTALPASEAYEAFIYRTKCVPTRHNLHDVFNALVWLHYPKTKQRLNELQAREIELRGTSGPRGALRDALTLFDENAAVLRAPSGVIDALRRRDWRTLFIEQRAEWQNARLLIFGHALLEKLVDPRKNITAHVWVMEERGAADVDDTSLAQSLTAERLANKPFAPLPVLGVPGWWEANESPDFYADENVFRPPRLQESA